MSQFIGTGKSFYHQGRPYMDSSEIIEIGKKEAGFGHPSGHSLNVSAFNMLLYLEFFYFANNNRFKPSRVLAWVFLVVMVIFTPVVMAFSRLYIGVHALN